MLHPVALLFKFQLFLTLLNAYEVKDQQEVINNVNVNASLTSPINGSVNNSKTPVSVATEGGSVPMTKSSTSSQKSEDGHHVSEHIVKNYSNVSVPLIDNAAVKINKDLGEGIPGKNDNKTVSSRKLTNSFSITTNSNSTTVNLTAVPVTKRPKKPTITEHDEAYYVLQASQDAASEDKQEEANNPDTSGIFTKAPTSSDRQKYLIPIVGVILSVPFVAILISLIYKKGSDWWRYRHYRRMDFLINGMYDT